MAEVICSPFESSTTTSAITVPNLTDFTTAFNWLRALICVGMSGPQSFLCLARSNSKRQETPELYISDCRMQVLCQEHSRQWGAMSSRVIPQDIQAELRLRRLVLHL